MKAEDELRLIRGEQGSLKKKVEEVEAQWEEAKRETEAAVAQGRAEKKVLVKEVKHLRKVVSDAEEEGRAARAAGKEYEVGGEGMRGGGGVLYMCMCSVAGTGRGSHLGSFLSLLCL